MTSDKFIIDFFESSQHCVGYIPMFLSLADPRPAREQFHVNYAHGGGWRPMEGWTFDKKKKKLYYPGDPPLKPRARITFRDEEIYIYYGAWVCIVQADGTFEVARMD